MLQKPEQIEFIGYDARFVDCWTIVLSFNDYDETITASHNPDYPQGVFSSVQGIYKEGIEKSWEELPESLQKFIVDYIERG